MKTFKIMVLFLLLTIGIFIAAIESGPGQRFMQKKLLEAFAGSGIHIEVEQFGGNLPQKIDLSNARIHFEGRTVQIKHLHIDLSLFPLLQKELSVEKLIAEGVRLERIPEMQQILDRQGEAKNKLPFALTVHSFQIKDFQGPLWPTASFEGKFKIERNGHAFLAIDVEDPLTAHVSAKGTWDNFSGAASGEYEDFSWKTHFLKKQGGSFEFLQTVVSGRGIHAQGQVWLDTQKRFAKADLALQTKFGKEPLTSSGSIEGYWSDYSFEGTTKAVGQFLQESWTLNSPLTVNKTKGIGLWKFHLQSPLFDGNGQLFWKGGKFSGHVESELDLSLFPNLNGRLWSKIDFNNQISGNAVVKNLIYESLYIQEVSIQGSTSQAVNIHLEKGKWKQFTLDTASLSAAKNEESWSGLLALTGPLATAQMKGYWRQNQIILEEGNGQYLGVPFRTETPTFIAWSSREFSWKPFTVLVGENGSLFFSIDRNVEKTEIEVNLQKFPLELLSSVTKGDLDVRAFLEENKEEIAGQFKASISNAEVLVQGDEYIAATAQLEASLEKDRLSLKSNLDVRHAPLAAIDLELPVHLKFWPFEGKIEPEGPASGSIFVNGKIEEIFDFFHLGMHRLAGNAACKMSMTGSLAKPRIEGSCKITKGHYENYLTGTELTNLTAEVVGKEDRLELSSFTAKDAKKKGDFTASGNIQISPPDHFPFHFDVDFTRMNIVQIDLINAEAEGHLAIGGDLESALAKGHIKIVEAEIAIPDKIPRSYPDLQVVYKNAQRARSLATQPLAAYPLNLEITIEAPEGVFIDGRGLHSEWQGQFNVGGTFASPSAQGKLELINGEFVFVGRRFKLTEGALSLNGKTYEMPNINIAGTTSEKGISITAHLAGPLNKPQITFQSSPPLPMSGILSYLLFGQDLSEVSGIQALQLAGTVATFAGEGPDILEITRKSLGVDRLQIVMTPSGSEGEETIALQVGKIVFPGFLVSIKQGADDSSPNIAIEVDLTHGFTFEAESQQQPEQGKFSLLWNLNY